MEIYANDTEDKCNIYERPELQQVDKPKGILLSPRNKASKIQKLAFRCFLLTSAKAKKFQDGDRSTRIYTENHHKFLSEGLTFFPAMGSTRREMKLYPRLQIGTHTHKLIAINPPLHSG